MENLLNKTFEVLFIYISSNEMYEKILNNKFWKKKSKIEFKELADDFDNKKDGVLEYVRILTKSGKVTYLSENFLDNHNCIIRALSLKNWCMVEYFENLSDIDWNLFLLESPSINSEAVEYCIKKGATNWNWGLRGSIKSKDWIWIDYFIKKGASDFDGSLSIAIRNNFEEFIKYSKGLNFSSYEKSLEASADIGDLNLVKYFLKAGAKNYNEAYLAAFEKGHENILCYLKEYPKI